MKFGKAITSHQVPEWSSNYMNYKNLKKQIKSILNLQKPGDESNSSDVKTALASFFFSIDRNIEKVDDFYNKQYTEYDRRLKKLSIIIVSSDLSRLDNEEIEEIVSVLVELRSCLRNLKWFAELNKRGFVKILKKLDKKVGTHQQLNYLNSRIYPLSFSNESEILKNLTIVNEYLTLISPYVKQIETTIASRSQSIAPDKFLRYVAKDDIEGLEAELIEEYNILNLAPPKLLISLLNKSALSQSKKCISGLLEIIPSLSDPSDISGRNFFHHHVIALGKQVQKFEQSLSSLQLNSLHITPASPPDGNQRLFNSFGPDGINSNDSPASLLLILQSLPAHLRPGLLQRDNYKRTPLHYAAQYGLREITTIIIDFLKSWKEWNGETSIDDLQHWGDSDDLSPLHLAVLGKHPKTVDVLLSNSNSDLKDSKILLLASRLNSPIILKSLLNCKGIDINYYDEEHHETALYISSKLNFIDTVKFLLENDADTEIGESSFGWTPIFISAVEGFGEVVKVLKEYGAKHSIVDDSGWTPMEHACLRGHLKIADSLKPGNYDALKFFKSPNSSSSSVNESSNSIDKVNKKSTNDLFKHLKPKLKNLDQQQHLHPIKSFGHRFLQNESMIIITLGSNDTRISSPIVKLDRVPISKIHSTELDTALSLVISTKNKNEIDGIEDGPVVIDLPLDDVDPITIRTKNANPEQEIIFFDIVPTYGAQHKQVLGRSVALLEHLYTKIGDNRTYLNKLVTLPIIETETLDLLGTISFEVLIVKPFHHPNMSLSRTEAYWKSLITTRVIGHRGLGKNINTSNSLQLGENTVESFIAAASLGASYVEFDVQLTKDCVPVVYHDFLIAETGIDIPMHGLTLEQFLSLNNEHDHNRDRKSKDDDFLLKSKSALYFNGNGSSPSIENSKLDKMKLTRTYKEVGFKGNSRGSSIASSFVTLRELFKKIPKSVGFNIECKYPLLYESQSEDLGEIAIDINHWVDTVLKMVYDNADGRDIIFSSFHPEICVLLSLKQPSIPILFLTESGTSYMPDIRCGSLQSAIRFSKKWNLLGIVSASEPIVKCPRLAQVVKSSGLVCFTYGILNNDPENSKLQMLSGVDAVIVDNVLAVRKGLTKDAKTVEENDEVPLAF